MEFREQEAYDNVHYKVCQLEAPAPTKDPGIDYNWCVINKLWNTEEGLFTSLPSAVTFADSLSEFLEMKQEEEAEKAIRADSSVIPLQH